MKSMKLVLALSLFSFGMMNAIFNPLRFQNLFDQKTGCFNPNGGVAIFTTLKNEKIAATTFRENRIKGGINFIANASEPWLSEEATNLVNNSFDNRTFYSIQIPKIGEQKITLHGLIALGIKFGLQAAKNYDSKGSLTVNALVALKNTMTQVAIESVVNGIRTRIDPYLKKAVDSIPYVEKMIKQRKDYPQIAKRANCVVDYAIYSALVSRL